MISDFVRDKDAIASCAMLAEMCAWAKDKGMTVFELLAKVYEEFGFYLEDLVSLTKKGMKGAEEIQQMMADFRTNTPKTLAGLKVVELLDYQSSKSKNLNSGEESDIDLPKSNVLQFILEDGSKISARPSGTEPKIKFYISVNQSLESKEQYDEVKSTLQNKIGQIKSELGL
jgi:phosphoglucomutase